MRSVKGGGSENNLGGGKGSIQIKRLSYHTHKNKFYRRLLKPMQGALGTRLGHF